MVLPEVNQFSQKYIVKRVSSVSVWLVSLVQFVGFVSLWLTPYYNPSEEWN